MVFGGSSTDPASAFSSRYCAVILQAFGLSQATSDTGDVQLGYYGVSLLLQIAEVLGCSWGPHVVPDPVPRNIARHP